MNWVLARRAEHSKSFTRRQLITVAVLSLVSFGLYIVGFRYLFVPVLVGVSVWRLPMPRILNSWVSRVVFAVLIVSGLLQVGSSLQFLVMPHTGFNVLAAFTLVLIIAVWVLAPSRIVTKLRIISANDLCALVIIACVVLPFTPILLGHNGVEKIAEITTVQASDGVRHYLAIENTMQAQNLGYSRGNYYPSGFYVAAAFVQSTFFHDQYQLGWQGNAYLYFGDYLLYASVLGYVLFYLCISWLRAIKEKLVPDGWAWTKLLVALSLAPSIVLLYLLPFMSETFLSYYYVCITLAAGLLFMGELRQSVASSKSSLDIAGDKFGRWWLLAFLILLYGAAMTWPLLIPPFVISGLLFLLPSRLQWRVFMQRVVTVRGLPVIIAFAIQLIPIYFQVAYSTAGTAQGINATGGPIEWHPFILFFGGLLVFVAIAASKYDEGFQRLLINIFLPLFGFIGLLMLYQYFTVGAIIYYVIKASLLLDMLLIGLGVAMLVSAFATSKFYEARYAWLLPAIPFVIVLLLVSSNDNPLFGVRDIFRHHSNTPIPQYFSQDLTLTDKLGESGKLRHFNMTELHYSVSNGKFEGNMQDPYWAGVLQYEGKSYDWQSFNCVGSLYYNLAFGDFSEADQIELSQNIKQCAALAKAKGLPFYVITDAASAAKVRQFVGSGSTLLY